MNVTVPHPHPLHLSAQEGPPSNEPISSTRDCAGPGRGSGWLSYDADPCHVKAQLRTRTYDAGVQVPAQPGYKLPLQQHFQTVPCNKAYSCTCSLVGVVEAESLPGGCE